IRLSLTTIVAPFTGAAPVPSISLPPFSTIICFLLASIFSSPTGAYLNCRARSALAVGSALGKGYQHDQSRTKPIARRLRLNARDRDGAVPNASGDRAGGSADRAACAAAARPRAGLVSAAVPAGGKPVDADDLCQRRSDDAEPAGDDLLSRLRAGN